MKLIIRLAFILMTTLIVHACGERNSIKKLNEGRYPLALPLNVIVNQIAAYPGFDEEFIGIGGSLSPQYLRFARMSEIATDTELVQLTIHPSCNVRAYAMRTLAKRHYKGLETLLKSRTDDTSILHHFSGCMGEYQQVNEYYRTLLISEKAYQYEKSLPKL